MMSVERWSIWRVLWCIHDDDGRWSRAGWGSRGYSESTMLFFIGLGLADEQDITLRGLNAIKKCTIVYLESYTSILHIPKERLESLYSKMVILADREMVESQADEILRDAQNEDIAFLVVGDPFGYPFNLYFCSLQCDNAYGPRIARASLGNPNKGHS